MRDNRRPVEPHRFAQDNEGNRAVMLQPDERAKSDFKPRRQFFLRQQIVLTLAR